MSHSQWLPGTGPLLSAQAGAEGVDTEWMGEALHDLCQPLTALHCRLFLGTLGAEGEARAAAMAEAIDEALVQCERAIAKVRSMQIRMQGMEQRGGGAA